MCWSCLVRAFVRSLARSFGRSSSHMLLLLGWSWLLSSFVLHMCEVQSYLYPITRNKKLETWKTSQHKQHITRQLMRSLAFKDHMFCNLLKAEICFLKYCIYCENYIFSDLLHCAFVKIHKANIIIQKYCQIRFGSCTELFNGSESFQFSFFSFQFYIGFNDPSFLSKESQQLYEIWWFATTLILIRLELGILMTFRFGCQGTPSHWLHSTLFQ